MKLKAFLSLSIAALMIFSCIKHEIIPAPTPKVELESKFTGTIGGNPVEFNEGVNGYTCSVPNETNLLSPPAQSSEIFCSEIGSLTEIPSVKIRLGKISWTGASQTDLPLATFNSFFTQTSNILPQYKDDCANGINIVYTDGSGTIYTSREANNSYTTGNILKQDAKFTNISQESDDTGDYSKYVCTFNCYVYYSSGPSPAPGLDSLRIQNAQFTGWFRKLI